MKKLNYKASSAVRSAAAGIVYAFAVNCALILALKIDLFAAAVVFTAAGCIIAFLVYERRILKLAVNYADNFTVCHLIVCKNRSFFGHIWNNEYFGWFGKRNDK